MSEKEKVPFSKAMEDWHLDELLEGLPDERKKEALDVVAHFWEDREFWRTLRHEVFAEKVMRFVMPIIMLSIIPILAGAMYFAMSKQDYPRARFMLECQQGQGLSKEECEQLAEDGYLE